MVDKYGFRIWTEEDHKAMWDENTTFEQVLLESVNKNPHNTLSNDFGPEFKSFLSDDEEIFAYNYGGVLSSRGGWFVVKKNDPKRIIRSIQTWLS